MVLISSNSIGFGKLKINKLKLLKNELKLQHSFLLTTHAIAIHPVKKQALESPSISIAKGI